MIQYVTVNRRDVTGAYHIQQYFSQVVATHVLLLSFYLINFHFCICCVLNTHTHTKSSFMEDLKYSSLTFFFRILILKGLCKEFASVMHFKT